MQFRHNTKMANSEIEGINDVYSATMTLCDTILLSTGKAFSTRYLIQAFLL